MSIIDYPDGSTDANALALTDGSTQLQVTSGTATQAGVISETGGPFGLEKIGSGTLIYTGANTYTGVTTISAGALQIGNGGTSGSITGNVTDNGGLVLDRSDTITFGGAISGSGGVTQAGSGTVILTGASTYTGGTTINSGSTLEIGNGGTTGSLPDITGLPFWVTNNGTLIFNRSDTSTFHNIVNGTGEIVKQGPGTLIVTGNLNGSGITISQGTLQFGSGPDDGAFNANVIDNATLTFGYNANFISHIGNVISGSGGVSVSGGGGVIYDVAQTYTGGTTIGAGFLQLGTGGSLSSAGALTINGGTFDLNGHTQAVGALSGAGGAIQLGSGSLTTNSNTNTNLAAVISGSGSLTKNGTGTLTLTAANSYTGGTTINGGTLAISADSNLGAVNSGITLNGGTFRFLDSFNMNGARTIVLNAAGGTIDTNGFSTSIGDNINNTGSITISGTGSLTKNGDGYLFLSGTQTYIGGTILNGGAIQVVAGSLASTGGVAINGGIFDFVASNSINAQVIGALSGVGGTLALNSVALTTSSNTNTSLAAAVSGSGSLNKAGTGALTLMAANTYTGITTVSQGTLLVDGAIASSALTVASGASLGGSGTVGTTSIQSGGKLTPGDGIGTLQVNGNLMLASGATYAEEVSPATADEILVTGNANIAGSLTANLAGGSYGHQTYSILHSTGTVSGTFANVSVTGLPAGLIAGLTYGAHDVTLTTDHAPTVTTSNRTVVVGATVALSSLVNVSDADGDPITIYELWDATGDSNAGYFVINGQRQPAGTIIDITAAQLAQTSFVVGTVATSLQIRASDGLNWSAGDNAAWAPFIVSPRVNHAPVLLPGGASAAPGTALALPSLFSVSDADGDAVTKYQLWDGNRDPNSGHFVVNGVVQPAGAVIEITAAQLSQTSFVVGQLGDSLQIRAFDGAAWSAGDNDSWGSINITPLIPALFPNGPTGTIGQSLAVSGFFNAVTPNGAITKYQLLDTTTDPNSGYFTINGVQQAVGAVIEITAAQLAQTSFVVGHINDTLQIRAFDGTAWSAPDNGAWTSVTVSPPPNHLPVLTTTSKTVAAGTTLALTSLFSVSDADGDTMTKYQLWDGNGDPSSGHFVIAGLDQSAGTVINVTAAQLAQTSFVVGATADTLQIRAFDGKDWSALDNAPWAPFIVTPPLNHAPVVTGLTQVLQRNWAVGLTSTLIAVSDPDGDTITKYQLWDGTSDPSSGYFLVNGQIQPARTVIEITAAQAAATVFVPGAVPDSLQVRAFDGKVWSASDNGSWSPFTIIPAANTPTTVFPHDRSGRKGDMFQLSTLLSTNDADLDPVVKYQLWDATRDPNSGYFTVSGVAQPAGAVIEVTAAQAAQTFFTLGSIGDNLQIRVFDGFDWSAPDNAAWAPVTMTVTPNHLPVVTTANKSAVANQTLSLSNLFSVSDADSDSIPAYQLWDATPDPNSGHFVVGGVDQAAGAVIQITAAQLSQTSFVAGTVGDSLQIRAMDSRGDWSAGDAAAWSPFTISIRNNAAPLVTTTDKTATAGQAFGLSSLFSVTDADGDSMTKYQLWDSTPDPISGHFAINGQTQSAGTLIEITAAQLSQTSFVAGASGHGDLLQIRAFDGFAWSAGDSAAWSSFHINVS